LAAIFEIPNKTCEATFGVGRLNAGCAVTLERSMVNTLAPVYFAHHRGAARA
jgi:hypothetical protein